MIVADASVVLVAVTDDGDAGQRARRRLAAEAVAAPELLVIEVTNALRKAALRGQVSALRADQAVEDLGDLPVALHSHRHFLARCWELRANVTTYDAAYVALAETLAATLVTNDARLARAPGVRCLVEVLDS